MSKQVKMVNAFREFESVSDFCMFLKYLSEEGNEVIDSIKMEWQNPELHEAFLNMTKSDFADIIDNAEIIQEAMGQLVAAIKAETRFRDHPDTAWGDWE